MNRKLFGETGPTIQAELALGRFYSEQQIYPSAITAYRQAFASLAKDPLARSQVVADQLIPSSPPPMPRCRVRTAPGWSRKCSPPAR